MRRNCILLFLVIILFSACSDKYLVYKDKYKFESKAGIPDFSNLNYWAAHPYKWDPSDSISAPLRSEKRDTLADVFFLYPTSFTKSSLADQTNASIDDAYLNAKTDYTSILYQASVFNQHCRIFAPRYRQAHISNFYTKDKVKAQAAFDLAYADVKNAFVYYLQHWNHQRPIIIAAHSQGSLLAERLLKEFFENKPLQKQLVVAYILGWPVPVDYFSSLAMCEDSLQTGCLCSWRTFRKGYIPKYISENKESSYVTNPLSWTITEAYAGKDLHKGSVLTNFNKIYRRTTDAQISNSTLQVKRPRFPWSFLYATKNYHVGDINLFYMNIRQNVEHRINAFLK